MGRKLTRDIQPDLSYTEYVMGKVKEYGIKIDLDLNRHLIDSMNKEWEDKYKVLESMTFNGISLNSVNDMRHLFTKIYNFEKYAHRTKKGGISFKAEVLDKIAEEEECVPAILIKELRSERSLINKLLEFDRYADDNGFIHPDWGYGETNRVSFNSPGISNIHKSLRKVVVAPDGYTLCKIDYKQQEPVILINWLGIDELKKLIVKYDDFYTALGVYLLDKVITEDERNKFKTAWLAVSYGASIPTIAKQIGMDFAKVFFDKVNNKLAEITKLKEKIKADIRNKDYRAISYFGTVRVLPYMGGYTERALLNNPVQMTGSNILNFAIEDVVKFSLDNGIAEGIMRVYWTIHDELILVIKNGFEYLGEQIAELISYEIDDWTPLKVNVKFSNSY